MIGFGSTKLALLSSYQNQKLHHAILLCGKKGIGKSSFAIEFAEEILESELPSHPDLFIVKKDDDKREINVDKVRKISDFVNQTSAISPNKFIIIDSACELNKSASNALLKILEEPRPNNFLILISHNLNKVLPTIRSRCQIVKIPDLSLSDFTEILDQKKLHFSSQDLRFLAKICDNSPADAVNMGNDLTQTYELFLRSIYNKKLSLELLKKISDKNFSFVIFEKSYEFFISRLIQYLNSASFELFYDEEKVFLSIKTKYSAKKIFLIADESLDLLRKTSALSLDKKLTLINIFNHFGL
jgi:DNA polymerase-3 subunit delta'